MTPLVAHVPSDPLVSLRKVDYLCKSGMKPFQILPSQAEVICHNVGSIPHQVVAFHIVVLNSTTPLF